MIFDNLSNAGLYSSISSNLKKAFDYLQSQDFTKVENGTYEIDGKNVFAIVKEYDSIPKADGKWEIHREYIDIQFIASGVESMGFCAADTMQPIGEFNTEKDILFLSGEGDYVTVAANHFAVFFPQDAHKPNLAVTTPAPIKKVIMKVRVG
jgi:YhcH/YjgK/YiaL family protein